MFLTFYNKVEYSHKKVFLGNRSAGLRHLTQMIGSMSLFGVRKKLPRKDAEIVVQNLDPVNAIFWIDSYISPSRMKIRLFTFRHIIGNASSCNRLMHQLGKPAPH